MIDDVQLRLKLQILFKKVGKKSTMDDWMNLMQKPAEFRKVGRNYAMIADEFSMKWFKVG